MINYNIGMESKEQWYKITKWYEIKTRNARYENTRKEWKTNEKEWKRRECPGDEKTKMRGWKT